MNQRLLALRPWLVRALIPRRLIGSYVLYTVEGTPTYTGRSDTDLCRRLVHHARERRAAYFTYDVHVTAVNAYEMECATFHLLASQLSNHFHPARPGFSTAHCSFCASTVRATLDHRIGVRLSP